MITTEASRQAEHPTFYDPHLAMLARVSGRTLLIVFLVAVAASALPFYPRSLEWSIQFSNRIVEFTSFAFVGVAFLRIASFLVPIPDPIEEPVKAMQLARQRDTAIRLCRLGMLSLLLLSLWQGVILFRGLNLIDQERLSLSQQLSQSISRTEQSIRQAPAGVVEKELQRLQTAQLKTFTQGVSDTEQQRQALLKTLQAEKKQISLNVSKQTGNKLFDVVISTVRRVAFCVAFIVGFQAMGKRLY